MFRMVNSTSRVLVQRVTRSTLNWTRAQIGTEGEAGSVASGNDAFSKKEHAEEARWARRHDAEAWSKYKAEHPAGQGTVQQRLAALETEKKRLEQEIAALKSQQR